MADTDQPNLKFCLVCSQSTSARRLCSFECSFLTSQLHIRSYILELLQISIEKSEYHNLFLCRPCLNKFASFYEFIEKGRRNACVFFSQKNTNLNKRGANTPLCNISKRYRISAGGDCFLEPDDCTYNAHTVLLMNSDYHFSNDVIFNSSFTDVFSFK